MLLSRFNLERPESVRDAVALLAEYGPDASPYAGGTELLVAMKARLLHYRCIVDLKRIAGLRGIAVCQDGGLSVGALTTHHELSTSPVMRERLPAYAKLSANIANIRVRVSGTLGGNLCFAEPHADPPAMLSALGAQVVLAGPEGERRLSLDDFILGELSTVRAESEIMVRVEIPAQPAGTRIGYRSFGHLERPAVTVAALATPLANGWRWRFRVGAICGRPTPLSLVEQSAEGKSASEALETIARTAPSVAAGIEARDDLGGSAEYKRHLAAVLAVRAARDALGLSDR